jgi:hypothetical protein
MLLGFVFPRRCPPDWTLEKSWGELFRRTDFGHYLAGGPDDL